MDQAYRGYPAMALPMPGGMGLEPLPRYNGRNMVLANWQESLRGTIRYWQIAPGRQAGFATLALEGDARKAVAFRPESMRNTLEDVFRILEGLFGGTPSAVVQKKQSGAHVQHKEECIQMPSGAPKAPEDPMESCVKEMSHWPFISSNNPTKNHT